MKRGIASAWFLIGLSACGPSPRREPANDVSAAAGAASAESTWFICDAVGAPKVFVATKADPAGQLVFREYTKASGEMLLERALTRGAPEGAAGSRLEPLLADGHPYATARFVNPQVLSNPTLAYTAPLVELTVEGTPFDCRWVGRTRFYGFTPARSVLVTEDEDGDLIYQSFDFAAPVRPVAFDSAQRSSVASLEVRGGDETSRPDRVAFTFSGKDAVSYRIEADRAGAKLQVYKDGSAIQTEPLLAFVTPAE